MSKEDAGGTERGGHPPPRVAVLIPCGHAVPICSSTAVSVSGPEGRYISCWAA